MISSSIRFFDLDPFTVSSSGRMFSLKSRLSFCSLNARGLKDKVKRKGIFLFCKGQKSHFVFLQETHSTDEDAVGRDNVV